MKKFLLFLCVLATVLPVQAQIGHGRTGSTNLLRIGTTKAKQEKESTPQMFGNQKKVKNTYYQQNTIVTKDSSYYANIVKKNGWWIGIGKRLSIKEASHLNCYYKLSKKNKAGNWTYIEAYDGYGEPTTYHSIGTYLVNQFDDEDKGANSDWKEKLQTVCKWEMVADASGNEVIQERALDADGDVVYIYSPVKVGDREYTGSFTDSWGMPIFMRTDSLGNDAGYANFVHITRDERGFEVLCSFTDRFGFPQRNKDGAYMTRREYDDNGNQIKEASLNIVGDNMIDDYGNCGWENTYKNNHRVSSTYFNADWEPMIFPNFRDEGYKVYGFRFEPDEFGRDTAMVVVDAKGNPDVDREYGIHKIINRYNDYGKQIYQAYYGINGNLIAGNKLGIAQAIYDFTQNGLIKSIEFKGPDDQYIVSGNGYCKKAFAYNKDGIEVSEIEYITNNKGELIKSFEYSRDVDGNTVRTWYQKDKQRVDSVDAQGRNILLAWYDLDGNPIENEGLHKDLTEFDDDNNVETETWLDKDGDPFVDDDRGYSKDVTIRDNANNIRTIYQYWYGGLLKQAYQQQFDPSSKTATKQWDITSYGEHARVGWYNNLHYTCDVDYTMYGDIRTMVGRNEFDEPAYLTFLGTSGEVYHFSNPNHGYRLYYDEFGVEIPDSTMDNFKSHLPRVYCIEVTDTSVAYPLGLRNGDIILTYGDWSTNNDLITDVEYFYLEAILKANKSKKITLLRHHPENKSSEIVTRTLPAGRTSDLGFYPHKIYYTQKEKTRLLSTSNKYDIALGQYKMQKDSTILLAVQTKGGFEQTRLYHLPTYDVKDPGVVLYAKEKYNRGVDTWSMHNTIERWDRQDMFRIRGANLYITQDCESTRHIDKQSRGLAGMTFVPVRVSTDIYNAIKACYIALGDSITGENNPLSTKTASVTKLKQKQLVGKWQTTATEDNVNYAIVMNLAKDQTSTFSIDAIMEGEIKSGITLKIGFSAKTTQGLWSIEDSKIILDFSGTDTEVNITDLDIIGVEDAEKTEMMEQLRNMVEQNKDELANNLNLSKVIEKGSLDVVSISSKSLVIMMDDSEMTFNKIK